MGWAGKVRALMINQKGADSGLEACATVTNLPILQDNTDAAMWTTLSAIYNSYLVIDQNGRLITIFAGMTLPGVSEELVDAVNAVL